MSGFTRIPNAILDRMDDLTPAELKLIIALYRQIEGYQDKRETMKARISYGKLAELTGLSRPGIKKAGEALAQKGYVEMIKDGYVTEWRLIETVNSVNSLDAETVNSVAGTVNSVNETVNSVVRHLNKEKRKENLKEEDAAIIAIIESWCGLTGRWPKNDKEGQREYGEPAKQILERVSWDCDRAWAVIQEARQNMLKTGRTPYRLSAIKPLAFAILDGFQETPAGSNGHHPDPAETAWSKLFDGSRFHLPRDGPTKHAVEATGGWARYKGISERDLPFLKKEFINAYQRTGN